MGKNGSLFGNIADLQVDENVEKQGVELAFGSGRFITITRAGSSNRRYRNALTDAYKPHRTALDRGTLDNETAERLLHKVFAKAIVLDWRGWLNDKGEEIPCTQDAVVELFREAPEVFQTVQTEADRFSNFAKQEVEEAGNE